MVIGTSTSRTGVRGVASGTVLFESECGTCKQEVVMCDDAAREDGALSSSSPSSELVTTTREAATSDAGTTTIKTTRRALSETEAPGLALRYFLCTLIAKSIRMNHSHFHNQHRYRLAGGGAAAAAKGPEEAPSPSSASTSPPPEHNTQRRGPRCSADGELLWVECDGLVLDLTDKPLPPWMVRAKPTLQSYVKQS